VIILTGYLWCDACPSLTSATAQAPTAAEAERQLRAAAAERGWVRLRAGGVWRDYCPGCAAALREAAGGPVSKGVIP
jgi:hypothetical protein